MLWTTAGWPIWVGCVLVAIAAVVHLCTGRIPNIFPYSAALVGLCVAVVCGEGGVGPTLRGGIGSSLGAAMITLVVLLFAFVSLPVGGGSVKLQTAYSAWLGCALPFGKALLLSLTTIAVVGLAYLIAKIVAAMVQRVTGGSSQFNVRLNQTWISALTVGTVVTFGLMDLL